jgi:sortase A
MSRTTPHDGATHGPDDQDLLSTLLADEVPSRQGLLRPARLHSATRQQQIALRGFRLRNWVDRALHFAERSLVLAAVVAFAYWLFDGPVRDWLHVRRSAAVVWADSSRPTATPALSLPGAPAAARAAAPALPFTRPDAAAAAAPAASTLRDEFLVPQGLPAAPIAEDPRPIRLIMPTIGTDMEVREVYVVNNEWEVAEYAAGYHHGTALPGTIGNSVLSGHAGLRGAVFRDLGRLQPGHEVIVETAGWSYVYRVRSSVNVWPTQIEVMYPTATAVLTLITCTNWDTQRLVVVADLVDARPRS